MNPILYILLDIMRMMWEVSEASKKLQFGKETMQNEHSHILPERFSSAVLLEAKH